MSMRLMLFGLFVSIGLSGCALFGGPSDTRLILTVDAVDELNPDQSGEPRSLYVNIFALKSAKTFTAATFGKLYDQPKAVLAEDLVIKREYTFQPGEQRDLELVLSPDVKVVGVVAAFRKVDEAQWRASKDVRPGRKNRFHLSLGTKTVGLVDK